MVALNKSLVDGNFHPRKYTFLYCLFSWMVDFVFLTDVLCLVFKTRTFLLMGLVPFFWWEDIINDNNMINVKTNIISFVNG